ncbi:MAG: hypothetical protein FWC97_00690 [Treponema sp.]|nr:hypothetical protein [Treponema sp.]
MKFIKYYKSVIFLFVVLFQFANCSSPPQPDPRIFIRVLEPSFSGNFSNVSDANFSANIMEIKIGNTLLFYPPIIIRERIVRFDNVDSDRIPIFQNWRDDLFYASSSTSSDTHLGRVTTEFRQVDNYHDSYLGSWIEDFHALNSPILRVNTGIAPGSGTVNDIVLRYNMSINSNLNFTFDVEQQTFNEINHPNVVHPIKPPAVLIHPRPSGGQPAVPNNISNSINLVVMAEGFRADQMRYFRSYVEDAFASVANFNLTLNQFGHEHQNNTFFSRHWEDNINVFMFETISPQAGIGHDVMSYFNVHHQIRNRTNMNRMHEVVNVAHNRLRNTAYHQHSLPPEHVDAYIILVNDQTITSYTNFHRAVSFPRNSQPVTYVIIRAPVGHPVRHNVGDNNFHQFVETHKIGQLLATAMASLFPEEQGTWNNAPQYHRSFRNISNIDPIFSKWRRMWENPDFRIPEEWWLLRDDDHRLSGNIRNPWFIDIGTRNQLFIPSRNCVMRGNVEVTTGTQFCPVCTYHLEGSFRTRMGIIPAQDPRFNGHDITTYEWRGFSIQNFMNDDFGIIPVFEDPVEFVAVG